MSTTIIVQVITPIDLYGPGDTALARWRDARGVEWAHYNKAAFVGNPDPEHYVAFRPMHEADNPRSASTDGFETCDLCHDYLFRVTIVDWHHQQTTFWLSKRGEIICECCMKVPESVPSSCITIDPFGRI